VALLLQCHDLLLACGLILSICSVEEATAAEEAAEEEVGDESMLEVMTPQVLQPNVPYLVQIKDWMERLGPNGTSKAKVCIN